MNCRKAQKLLIDFADQSLAGTARKELETHLAQCEHCRTELAHIRTVRENLLSLETPEPGADFWEEFDRKLSQKLDAEGTSRTPAERVSGVLVWRPRVAYAAAALTMSLIAVLVATAFFILQRPPQPATELPVIARETHDSLALYPANDRLEFFAQHGFESPERSLADLSEEELAVLEEEMFIVIGPDLEPASQAMVPEEIYEYTVYDMLDDLSYEDIETLCKELGLT